jgi:hypothetical protein
VIHGIEQIQPASSSTANSIIIAYCTYSPVAYLAITLDDGLALAFLGWLGFGHDGEAQHSESIEGVEYEIGGPTTHKRNSTNGAISPHALTTDYSNNEMMIEQYLYLG